MRSSSDRASGRSAMRATRVAAAGGVVAGLLATVALVRGPDDPALLVRSDEGEVAVPDVAVVVCDGQVTTVDTPQVRPQRDGVHLRVENTTGGELRLDTASESDREDVRPTIPLNPRLPPGVSDVVWPVPPGSATVACAPADPEAGGPAADRVAFGVVDPHDVWVEPAPMECGGGDIAASIVDYAFAPDEGQPGADDPALPRDATEAARQEWSEHPGLVAGDQIRLVGYPDDWERVVQLVRDGHAIAERRYIGDDERGWRVHESSGCLEVPVTTTTAPTTTAAPTTTTAPQQESVSGWLTPDPAFAGVRAFATLHVRADGSWYGELRAENLPDGTYEWGARDPLYYAACSFEAHERGCEGSPFHESVLAPGQVVELCQSDPSGKMTFVARGALE